MTRQGVRMECTFSFVGDTVVNSFAPLRAMVLCGVRKGSNQASTLDCPSLRS